jgi:hypothetical protein
VALQVLFFADICINHWRWLAAMTPRLAASWQQLQCVGLQHQRPYAIATVDWISSPLLNV